MPEQPRQRRHVLDPRLAGMIAARLERALRELKLDVVTYSRLAEIVCPEAFGDEGELEPTKELPHTAERLEVFTARAAAGLPLCSPGDADLPDELAQISIAKAGNFAHLHAVETVAMVNLREGAIGKGVNAGAKSQRVGKSGKQHVSQGVKDRSAGG